MTILALLIAGQSLGLLFTGVLLQNYRPITTVLLLFIPQCTLAILAALYRHLRKEP